MNGMWGQILGEDKVWGAFGCHPHHALKYTGKVEESLRKALHNSKVRALGEIGLDYSERNNCSKGTQKVVFQRQLKVAMLEGAMPVVIHCREATEDAMCIMKKVLPRDYRIHLHCFTGNWTCAQQWMEAFPNLFIGLTNLVTFQTAVDTHLVAKMIPLDRLLLETDAPHFMPSKVSRRSSKFAHPGMGIHVAGQIAAIRGLCLKEIIHHTRVNTRRVYGI